MFELVINRGIPGSGKSTYARNWVMEGNNNRARVNRDDIRMQLYGVEFGPPIDESVVTAVETDMISTLLEHGVSVIIDDCNISQRYINRWIKIAKSYDIPYRINLIDVPLEVAIERNQKRDRFVPVDVIERMYKQLQAALNV